MQGTKTQGERRRLADLIHRRRSEIVQRWLGTIRRDVVGRDHDRTDLRDGIEDYLEGLARAMRGLDEMNARGTAAWVEIAREHARTRLSLGFDINQLVHEFVVLRRTLFQVALESGFHFSDVVSHDLVDFVEAALGTAVKSYVESRDYAARKSEAEHIGFVTHELRNPLTTAVLAGSQLRRALGDKDKEEKALGLLEQSHRRLQDLVEKVLLTERLEADKLQPNPVEVSLRHLMDVALAAAQNLAREKGVELTVDYDPELLLRVDLGLATSIVQNVVDNAVKFADTGQVSVYVQDQPSQAVIHVRDTCGGLSSEELRTIFEPFKRGHHGKAGSGLGLAIARRAVEAHGGNIHAEGTENGCHFWFTLPKAHP